MATTRHLDAFGIVGDIGSKSMALALLRADGSLDLDSLQVYETHRQPTFSGVVSAFARDSALPALPRRCAFAIAGPSRGETMTLANSRTLISRTGLRCMLRGEPVFINECAASARALAEGDGVSVQPIGGAAPQPQQPGTFCLMAIGTGLGVAVVRREPNGAVTVLETEAAHASLPPGMDEDEEILAIVHKLFGRCTNETVISAPGLCRLYAAHAARQGAASPSLSAEEITHRAGQLGDPIAVATICTFARLTWMVAGNMALCHGAWDGVYLSGKVVQVLRASLSRPDAIARFAVPNPYMRTFRQIPLALVSFDHGELRGARRALLASAERDPQAQRAA